LKNYWNIFRLRFHLHSLERERDRSLLTLGMKVFQLINNREFEREDLKENYQEIISFEDEIDQTREAIYQEQGGAPHKRCKSCGKYVDGEARYCPSCGSLQERSKQE